MNFHDSEADKIGDIFRQIITKISGTLQKLRAIHQCGKNRDSVSWILFNDFVRKYKTNCQ
jgi:hypothetical protein